MISHIFYGCFYALTVQVLERISSRLQNKYWNVTRRSCSESTGFNMTIWGDDVYSNVTCDCSFVNNTVCHVTHMYALTLFLFKVFVIVHLWQFGKVDVIVVDNIDRKKLKSLINNKKLVLTQYA